MLKQNRVAVYATWGMRDPGHRGEGKNRSYIRDRMSYAGSPRAADISQVFRAEPYTHTRHDVGAKDQDQVKAITRETEVSRTGE